MTHFEPGVMSPTSILRRESNMLFLTFDESLSKFQSATMTINLLYQMFRVHKLKNLFNKGKFCFSS